MTVMHTEPCPTNDGGRGTCVCFPTDTPLYQMQRLGKDDTRMTPEQSDEEARRCIDIVHDMANELPADELPLAYRDRILAAVKPTEPPSPWPLELPDEYNGHIYGDHMLAQREGGTLYITVLEGGANCTVRLSPEDETRLRDALVADASTAEKDRLLVALCRERGIDLEYAMRSCMPEAFYEDEGYLTDERDEALLQAIRDVLDNAKETPE